MIDIAFSPDPSKSRKQNYDDYLLSPQWQVKRKGALDRAGGKCQMCAATKRQLHVHHNNYHRLFDELPTDLIVLCCDCHRLFHGRVPAEKPREIQKVQKRSAKKASAMLLMEPRPPFIVPPSDGDINRRGKS